MNSKLNSQHTTGPTWFDRSPFFELLVSAVVVLSHAFSGLRPRIVSDALFIEGMALSVVGALIAGKISEAFSLSPKVKDDEHTHSTLDGKRGFWASLFKKRTGFRILLVGLILVTAAIVIGELSRPR